MSTGAHRQPQIMLSTVPHLTVRDLFKWQWPPWNSILFFSLIKDIVPYATTHSKALMWAKKIYAQLFTFLLHSEEACIRTVHPSISFVTLL